MQTQCFKTVVNSTEKFFPLNQRSRNEEIGSNNNKETSYVEQHVGGPFLVSSSALSGGSLEPRSSAARVAQRIPADDAVVQQQYRHDQQTARDEQPDSPGWYLNENLINKIPEQKTIFHGLSSSFIFTNMRTHEGFRPL